MPPCILQEASILFSPECFHFQNKDRKYPPYRMSGKEGTYHHNFMAFLIDWWSIGGSNP